METRDRDSKADSQRQLVSKSNRTSLVWKLLVVERSFNVFRITVSKSNRTSLVWKLVNLVVAVKIISRVSKSNRTSLVWKLVKRSVMPSLRFVSSAVLQKEGERRAEMRSVGICARFSALGIENRGCDICRLRGGLKKEGQKKQPALTQTARQAEKTTQSVQA